MAAFALAAANTATEEFTAEAGRFLVGRLYVLPVVRDEGGNDRGGGFFAEFVKSIASLLEVPDATLVLLDGGGGGFFDGRRCVVVFAKDDGGGGGGGFALLLPVNREANWRWRFRISCSFDESGIVLLCVYHDG